MNPWDDLSSDLARRDERNRELMRTLGIKPRIRIPAWRRPNEDDASPEIAFDRVNAAILAPSVRALRRLLDQRRLA